MFFPNHYLGFKVLLDNVRLDISYITQFMQFMYVLNSYFVEQRSG